MFNYFEFNHSLDTRCGSSGSPICLISNQGVIGIHKSGIKSNFINQGTFIGVILDEFQKEYNFPPNINNNINQNRNKIIAPVSPMLAESKLKSFNKKYKLDIKSNISFLNFGQISNEFLKDLCELEFKKLRSFDLSMKNISDINGFEKANFTELKDLEVRRNKISDINIFEKVNFPKLFTLYLNNNNISDINVFEKVNFQE